MLYLHSKSLSPDPSYGLEGSKTDSMETEITIYPHELLSSTPSNSKIVSWGKRLDIFREPEEIKLTPDSNSRAEFLFDFGTEIDGQLNLEIETDSTINLVGIFGESEAEASGLIPGHHPNPTLYWHIEKGKQHVESNVRGFRFVRLVFCDIVKDVTLRKISAHASLTFGERNGDFLCSDKQFQQVWQSSIYTARLCAQKDTIWDGIKRDRWGWFGDARIIKLALDNVFFDPHPAEAMLSSMPSDKWANGIPNYSFDGIAMLREHILTYGKERPCVTVCYKKIKKLLKWVWGTQINEDGLIIRTDQEYFGNMGFLDWSDFPCGGRFEELSWLQFKYLAALKDMQKIAEILEDNKTFKQLAARIDSLERVLIHKFWDERGWFIHTLNKNRKWKKRLDIGGSWKFNNLAELPAFGIHYRKTYVENEQCGSSGPSRHCNALAVIAGLVSPAMEEKILNNVFNSKKIKPLITAYFLYYEQLARGLCNDPAGALLHFRDYIGTILEKEQTPTIWERYDPNITDNRKYYGRNWEWPYSLCHGWGAGAVPLTTRFLLGIVPVKPGFEGIALKPCSGLDWTFHAVVPTPYGEITVEKETPKGKISYRIPKNIQISPISTSRQDIDLHIQKQVEIKIYK